MIVKYLNGETWGYIDKVKRAVTTLYSGERLLARKDVPGIGIEAQTTDVYEMNKKFMAICEDFANEGLSRHAENLIITDKDSDSVSGVMLYLDDAENDAFLLVTNQKVYLLNDKGQTIERIN